MCMVDWRLGRLIRSSKIGGTSPTSIPRNNQRVGLIISLGVDYSTTFGGAVTLADPSGVVWFFVGSHSNPKTLLITEYGDAVQKQWTVAASNGTPTWSIVELTLPEEYISAALDSFNSEYKPWLLATK